MADQELIVKILADPTQYERTMDRVGAKTETTGGKLTAFGKAAVAGLAVGAAAAIGAFAQDSIRAFSDLEQSVGGTEAVFGDSSAAIDDFAQRSAESIGLSEAEFRNATTSIGGQLKRMTGDVDFAAEHSIILTQTAADLAATYGGTTAEAVQALGAAFRGEADPAERFNLDLKTGRVNAKALEMGLADANGKIDDQARAQATLALITEQSADAVGQFGREQDTIAGQTQILNAELENQKAAVGEQLAPAWQGLQTLGMEALGVFGGLIEKFQSLEGIAKDSQLAEWGRDLGDSFDALWQMIGLKTTPVVGEFTRTLDDGRGSQVDYSQAVEDAEEAVRDESDAIRDNVSALQERKDWIRAQLDPLFALSEADRKVEEATLAVTEAEAEFTKDSPQYREAVEDLAAAGFDMNDALLAVQENAGNTKEEIETWLRSSGTLSESMIDLILGEWERLNAFRFDPKVIQVTHRVTGGGVQERASGGMVDTGASYLVGERGPELFTPHGSGSISPASKSGMGGGDIYHITVQAGIGDPQAIAKAIDEMLAMRRRRKGGRLDSD